MTLDQRLVGDVLCDRRFTDAVWANQYDVGGVLEELQRHQCIDDGPIAAFGPRPVEVAKRFEAADMRGAQPAFQTAALNLHGLLAHWNEVAAEAWVTPLLGWEEQERARRGLERRLRSAHIGRFKPLCGAGCAITPVRRCS